jgi:hypothetical protein
MQVTAIPETSTTDTMVIGEVRKHLNTFEADMQDGLVCNFPYMWSVAQQLKQTDITGDAFTISLAVASLMRIPRNGTQATHRQIAKRATTLKTLVALSEKVGWPAIMSALGIQG